ncbi:MAG: hypothetical protein GON13_02580 [Nanoarchaeota archaeon]|nr:hypothetical protein [Nanoarchaeota archaeon]
MKQAILALVFLTLVLAMFGGFDSKISGNYVSPAKIRAVETINVLNNIDVQVRENDFLINTNELSTHNGIPILISGEETELILDFSFLNNDFFNEIDNYVNFYKTRTYLKIESEIVESELKPSGFLQYSCNFKIPKTVSGKGILVYETKTWSKNVNVIISNESEITLLGITEITL